MKFFFKLFLVFILAAFIFFLQKDISYAQTCGGSGQCGTYTTSCTYSDGTSCTEGLPGCTCSSSCNLTTSTYSCSYNTIISACTPNYPEAVPECSAGGCAQNNCTGPTYPNCNSGASCGAWTVECGSASRTCTYTTYSGGGTCTQNNFTDTDTILCPTGEYCSTNTCYAYRDITGTVYVDSNRDGVAEINKSGVDIARTGGSTTTNASGNYAFNNLTQGTYTVSMTVPSGYVVKPGTQTAYSVVATTSDKVQNFWISDDSDITGKVVIDYNHNGIEDGDDTRFDSAGSPISLSGGPTSKANVGTDASGDYSFNTLLWGDYTVTLNVPSGYTIVNTNPKTVALGQNNVTVNFFITPTYTITAHVGEDLDNTPNTNVNNYSGAKIDLLSGGVQVDTCTTVASGSCSFTGLISKLYRTSLNLPAGYEGRLPAQSDPNFYDCTPNSCIGVGTYTVTQDMPASPTTTDETVNFVMTKLYDITGGVYRDTNGGARSADVIYSSGTNVALRQGGTTVANDNAGTFAFNDNRPGTYTLVMSVPSTYEGVPGASETCIPSSGNCTTSVSYTVNLGPNASHNFVIESAQLCSVTGSVTTTTGAAVPNAQLNLSGGATATTTSGQGGNFAFLSSYPDGTGLTVTLTVPTGYTIANGIAARAAGVCPDSVVNYILNAPASAFDISGSVFNDNDGSGTQQSGEPLHGTAVTLDLKQAGTTIRTTNSSGGNYSFTNLPADTYNVALHVPSGWYGTNADTCSPADCQTVATQTNIIVGPDKNNVDFGIDTVTTPPNPPGCNFVGTVYVDTDFDNVGDRPYGAGTTINLRHGGTLDDTDTTGQGGKYLLNTNTALPNYRVQLDIPAGYQEVSTNPINNLNCPASLNTTITRDFVIRLPGCQISGNVYTDTNGNGVRDGGESGISGTTVTIKRGGSIVDTRTTNVAGSYASTQTTGYSYSVSVPQPGDTAISTPPNPRTVTVCPDATANFGFTPIPKGYLDGATCNNWGGWTCDASNYNTALSVHFYADGPAGGGGTLVASTVANTSRSDLGGVCGGVLTHGFNYTPIPASLKDGQSHTIYAYGIDTPTSAYNPLLGGSPKTINCAPSGSISVDPPGGCIIPPDDADGLCGVIIPWICEGSSCGVCVSTPGSGESVFSSGASSVLHSPSAPWINATDPYTFVLRSPLNSCTGPEIDRIVVRATPTYMISGAVYVDSNGNGAKDAGESNYTGANLTVRNSSTGAIVASPVTRATPPNPLPQSQNENWSTYATNPPASATQLAPGEYDVTLAVPAGYALTVPPNPRTRIFLGPNFVANFGIRPSYTVTATALVDINLDNCATGATNYTATLISFLLTDQTLGTSSNSGPQNDGTHTFSNVLLNPQQASFSVPAGYRISGITGAPVAGSRVGNSLNFTPTGNQTVDFCITDAVAWFQTNQGDVRYPKIVNKVPVGLAAGTSGNSVFISSSSTADFGQGGTTVGDKNKWKINNEYTTNSGAKNTLGSFSYDFYKNRAAKNNIGITLLSAADAQCVDGNCTLPTLATGVYELNGDLIINGSATQTNHVVILVNGNTTITGDILTSGNGLFILAAKQNMTIDKSVGTTTLSSLAPQLSGFFSAQNSIVIDGDGTAACSGGPGDARLNVEGALIANSLYPFADNSAGGKIQNNRSLCSSDDTYPAFYVAMKPEFFTELTDFYKVTNKRWMQVQP